MRTLYRGPLAPVLLLALCGPLLAADSDRDRKARAALALAGAKAPGIAAAPAPRLVAPRDYATGAKSAVAADKPLVVFVGCKNEHSAPGAVTAKADTLPGVEGPAAVVLYPSGGELYRHAVLRCPVDDAELRIAVRAAAKKVDEPAKGDKAAPKPLNWDVRAEPVKTAPTAEECKCDVCPCCGKSKAVEAPKADPAAACVRVAWDRFGASGVCVASEGGKSLVVSNNHVFTERRTAFGEFDRADYPLACSVRTLDGKRTLQAVAVDGDKDADIAFLIVDGELPVAEMAEADAAVGTAVWHRGIGSGGGEGKVLAAQPHSQAKQQFASSCSSESGDSGAGVFDSAGRVVAVNCGRHGMDLSAAQRGTPITPIRNLIRGVARKSFPKLAAKLGTAPPVAQLPAVEPKPEVKPAAAPTVTPVQYVPVTYRDAYGRTWTVWQAAGGCSGGRCNIR